MASDGNTLCSAEQLSPAYAGRLPAFCQITPARPGITRRMPASTSCQVQLSLPMLTSFCAGIGGAVVATIISRTSVAVVQFGPVVTHPTGQDDRRDKTAFRSGCSHSVLAASRSLANLSGGKVLTICISQTFESAAPERPSEPAAAITPITGAAKIRMSVIGIAGNR